MLAAFRNAALSWTPHGHPRSCIGRRPAVADTDASWMQTPTYRSGLKPIRSETAHPTACSLRARRSRHTASLVQHVTRPRPIDSP
jgi:hypothetical protein